MSAARKHTALAFVSAALVAALLIVGSAGGRGGKRFDKQAPSVPANIRVIAATPTSVSFAWDASADNVGVVGYYVFADGHRTRIDGRSYMAAGLECGSSVGVWIIAFDAARNRSERASATVSTAACPDTEPPTPPSGFRQAATTQNEVMLAWDASADNVGVVGYGLYRGGLPVGSTSAPETTLTGLSCGTNHEYAIDAVDAAGNRSQRLLAWAQTADCSDGQPPSTPSGLAVTARTASSISLSWWPSSDNVRVTGYDVSSGGTTVMTVRLPSATLQNLTCGMTYTIGVAASDDAGNRSPAATISGTTDVCPLPSPLPPSGDTTRPSTPSGLATSNVTQTSLTLTWNASSDNVGVTSYDVYRDGTKTNSVTAPSSSQTGLACGTSYSFAVAARDAAGNSSEPARIDAAAAACSPPQSSSDTTPPSTPISLAVAAATRTSVTLTWLPSTDNVGVAGYGVYRNGASVSTAVETTSTISNLTCGTAHSFEVDSFDAAGNRSTRAGVTASTSACADTQPPTSPVNVTSSSRTATSIALSWSPSSDNVGVAGYGLYRGGTSAGTTAVTTGIFSGLTCNTNYTLAVDAYDAAGNRSQKTTVMVATTACLDATPPSTPTGLAASNVTQTNLTLNWNASSDNVAVTGYDVYRNGTKMATVTSTSSNEAGLACGTSYAFAVVAVDAAGNRSAQAQLAASTAACSAPPPPPSAGQLTGTHWAETNEYGTLKDIGYGFAVTNVAPGDLAGAKAKLDAAKAAGIRLIIGLYAFGGPEPYSYSNGQWAMTQATQDMLNYFESRESEILAFFGFNEPYWVNQFTGAGDSCGAHSAAQLRAFRDEIRSVWPGAKIFHDIGWPSAWAPGGDVWQTCVGEKYADQTGVADYAGIWHYPFRTGGVYLKSEGLARLQKEATYVVNSMGAVPVWLGQAHSGVEGLGWPSDANLSDWNCSIRSALPAGSLISWYVWRQGIYPDYLANHPELWPKTTQSVCP